MLHETLLGGVIGGQLVAVVLVLVVVVWVVFVFFRVRFEVVGEAEAGDKTGGY